MAEIGIITPTFHRPHSLRVAIESVLRQTFTDWKLYIIGDHCTDETEAVLAEYRDEHDGKIVWCNLPENHSGEKGIRGVAPRNHGFDISEEPIIAYLDDDDLWLPDHLRFLREPITDKGADFSYSRGIFISLRDLEVRVVGKESPVRLHIGTNALMHTRRIANRSVKETSRESLWRCVLCHDWDVIDGFMQVAAKWRYVPQITYAAYWGFPQEFYQAQFTGTAGSFEYSGNPGGPKRK